MIRKIKNFDLNKEQKKKINIINIIINVYMLLYFIIYLVKNFNDIFVNWDYYNVDPRIDGTRVISLMLFIILPSTILSIINFKKKNNLYYNKKYNIFVFIYDLVMVLFLLGGIMYFNPSFRDLFLIFIVLPLTIFGIISLIKKKNILKNKKSKIVLLILIALFFALYIIDYGTFYGFKALPEILLTFFEFSFNFWHFLFNIAFVFNLIFIILFIINLKLSFNKSIIISISLITLLSAYTFIIPYLYENWITRIMETENDDLKLNVQQKLERNVKNYKAFYKGKKGDKFYIYEYDKNYYITEKIDNDNWNLIDTYVCENDGCKVFDVTDDGKYTFVVDGNYFLYNIGDKSKEQYILDVNGIFSNYSLINIYSDTNGEPRGLVLAQLSNQIDVDETYAYYDLKDSKYIISMGKHEYIDTDSLSIEKNYLYMDNNLYDAKTGKLLKTNISGSIYGKKVMYFYSGKYGHGSDYAITRIMDEKFYELDETSDAKIDKYYISNNDELILLLENKYIVYDDLGKVKYTSDVYDEVIDITEGYIIVNKSGKLIIVNYEGKQIVELCKISSSVSISEINPSLLLENNNLIFYMFDSNVSWYDLSDNEKKNIEEKDKDNYSYGYKYLYNISTCKLDIIPVVVD